MPANLSIRKSRSFSSSAKKLVRWWCRGRKKVVIVLGGPNSTYRTKPASDGSGRAICRRRNAASFTLEFGATAGIGLSGRLGQAEAAACCANSCKGESKVSSKAVVICPCCGALGTADVGDPSGSCSDCNTTSTVLWIPLLVDNSSEVASWVRREIEKKHIRQSEHFGERESVSPITEPVPQPQTDVTVYCLGCGHASTIAMGSTGVVCSECHREHKIVWTTKVVRTDKDAVKILANKLDNLKDKANQLLALEAEVKATQSGQIVEPEFAQAVGFGNPCPTANSP
jgi:hypothetical protein